MGVAVPVILEAGEAADPSEGDLCHIVGTAEDLGPEFVR